MEVGVHERGVWHRVPCDAGCWATFVFSDVALYRISRNIHPI